MLNEGIRTHTHGVALTVDVRELASHIASCSVDLCVSTHNISHLNESEVSTCISSLMSLNKKGEDLLFNIESTSLKRLQMEGMLITLYEKVVIRRYRNVFSRTAESTAEDEIGTYRSVNTISARILNRILYYSEKVTSVARIGSMTLVMCRARQMSRVTSSNS